MKKNASASHFSQILCQTDIRKTANFYAAQLEHICCPLRNGSGSLAGAVHAHMMTSGFKPRGHILNRLIDIYCKSNNLIYARRLFDAIPQPDIVARTTLIAAYSNAGDLNLARKVFDGTPVSMRDVVSYNAMISAYSRNGDGLSAVQLYIDMGRDCLRPEDFTFTSVLSGLAIVVDNERQCQQLHCAVVKSGTESVVSVSNALLSVYMKCPSLSTDSACLLFNSMPERDELSWTTIITGYVRRGNINAAWELFEGMEAKFDVVWNAMISGFVHHGLILDALEMFKRMHSMGVVPDEFTYTSLLSACANAGLLQLGKELHAHILRTDPTPDPELSLPVENALITLYWKCGKLDDARQIFDEMRVRDLVSWNAILSGYATFGRVGEARRIFDTMPERSLLTWTMMISGFAQNGLGEEGLKLFNRMKEEGVEPCDFAFAGAITACAGLGALEHGRQLHAQLIRHGFDSSISAGNALVTMYARCGVVEAAHGVFFTMPFVDSVSWNAMIAALGQHGQGTEALDLFDRMLHEGISPDRITFLTVLSACSHAGLVEEGCRYFELMENVYGITPSADHYARLIDLLCRAGRISEAKNMIGTMPFKPRPPIWEALLSGCCIHGDMALGIHAAEKLFELTPQHDGTYVLLSNMYAAVGRWDDVARVRKMMKDRGVKKEPGCSWIDVANKVHVFLVDDTVHPEVQQVYRFLESLGATMRKLGYVPNTKFVLHDVESEQKEYVLSTHSEKLAVGYGLLKLPLGATVRVLKNLRICGDCHAAIMFMSMVVDREIVVRDGKRFHHFRNGECSCGNYW
ncbi:pentatricopeptide repeat-containing protein At1g25360 [Magnolia sinica]|uniref:pentatricopeptide repeat-containing protein At1g25360 n=1 Tax=Magnolia sinica TaxID=86752 RepID=UPI002659D72A|nr:pentatricopeptide repeat-containing protein At1g25360 [Magnolia sinica]